MTVRELKVRLEELIANGAGDCPVAMADSLEVLAVSHSRNDRGIAFVQGDVVFISDVDNEGYTKHVYGEKQRMT